MKFLESSHIDHCEAQLSEILASSVVRNAVHRVFLGFPGPDGELLGRSALKTDIEWPIGFAKWTEGQIGATFRTGEITRWPEERVPYKQVSARTKRSVCYPVFIGREIVGALLFDFFEGEDGSSARFHQEAALLARKCGEVLFSPNSVVEGLYADIRHLTERCRAETGARRGYTAIQLSDRPPLLIRVGKDTDVFRELGFDEGLTGEVLRTGEPIVLGNVLSHASYLSSDDTINSEAVFPLMFERKQYGVLNLEAIPKDHFGPLREKLAHDYGVEISRLVHEYVTLNDTSDSHFSRALSYLSSSALTTGMVGAKQTMEQNSAQILDILRQSVISLGYSDWNVAIHLPPDFVRLEILEPKTGVSSFKDVNGVLATRIFVFDRGLVFCCVEVKASLFLNDIHIGRIDFLSRAVMAELRRRRAEWSVLGFQSFVDACLTKKFSYEQVTTSFLTELCSFLEADLGCVFASRKDKNLGRIFAPIFAINQRKGNTSIVCSGYYSHSEANKVCSAQSSSNRRFVTTHDLGITAPKLLSDIKSKTSVEFIECDAKSVSAVIVIPLVTRSGLSGFLRFTRILGGMERRFHSASLVRAQRISQFLHVLEGP